MGQDEQLPDGFKYDGEEQENVFNIEVSADKLTFTAKTDVGDNENPAPDENKMDCNSQQMVTGIITQITILITIITV